MLTKGQKVTLLVHGAGLTTKEKVVVTCVTAHRFWLNGDEPNEDAAYNLDTGKRNGVFGFSFEVENFPRLRGGPIMDIADSIYLQNDFLQDDGMTKEERITMPTKKKKAVKKTKRTTTTTRAKATKIPKRRAKKTTVTTPVSMGNDGFNASAEIDNDYSSGM